MRKYGSDSTLLAEWGRQGQAPGEFVGPVGIAVDTQGYFVVADRSAFRVQRFAPDGKRVSGWGSEGSGSGQFQHIGGVAIDAMGHVYVGDFIPGGAHFGRIQKFTATGGFVRAWTLPGDRTGDCGQPSGMAVDRGRGCLYVADARQHAVHLFDLDGQPLARHDTGEAFSKPDAWIEAGLAVDRAGSLYMSDLKRRQVRVWRCQRLVEPAWPSA